MMLDSRQRELLSHWVPDARPVADLSWGLTDSMVLHMVSGDMPIIVKAGGHTNHHIPREISAYETAVPALAKRGFAPSLLHGDKKARILVTTFIPGTLVDSGPLEGDPEVLRQAGKILRLLHDSGGGVDTSVENSLMKAAIRWLDKPHRIPPQQARRALKIMTEHRAGPAAVVPSHGDYSGRNWIRGTGLVVIDFGRFGHRPARQDFLRLFFRRWYDHPDEAKHFAEGYGEGMELDGYRWWIDVLREAVATAGWAHKVGDTAFEELGLKFIDVALDHLSS